MAIAATAREDIALGGRSSAPGANGFYRCLSVRSTPRDATDAKSDPSRAIASNTNGSLSARSRQRCVEPSSLQRTLNSVANLLGSIFSQSIARSTYGPPADGPRGQARSPCRPLVTYSNAQAAASFANFTSSGSRRSLHCSAQAARARGVSQCRGIRAWVVRCASCFALLLRRGRIATECEKGDSVGRGVAEPASLVSQQPPSEGTQTNMGEFDSGILWRPGLGMCR